MNSGCILYPMSCYRNARKKTDGEMDMPKVTTKESTRNQLFIGVEGKKSTSGDTLVPSGQIDVQEVCFASEDIGVIAYVETPATTFPRTKEWTNV